MSAAVYRIMYDDAFQARCQRYAHGNGTSEAIARAALQALSPRLVECEPSTIAAAPDLLVLATRGMIALEAELSLLLESVCLLDNALQPIRDTIDPEFDEEAAALERAIAEGRAVIASALGAA
jgi:hypothetical protein